MKVINACENESDELCDVFMKLHKLMGYNFQIEKCKFQERLLPNELLSIGGSKINKDMNGEKQEGFGMYDVTIHKGERASVSRYYLNPAKKRKNSHINTSHTNDE